MSGQAAKPHYLASPAERPIHLPFHEITTAYFQSGALPAALVGGSRAVALPVAEAFTHAGKEARPSTGAKAPSFGEGVAGALGYPSAEASAHPKVIADTQADPGSET